MGGLLNNVPKCLVGVVKWTQLPHKLSIGEFCPKVHFMKKNSAKCHLTDSDESKASSSSSSSSSSLSASASLMSFKSPKNVHKP